MNDLTFSDYNQRAATTDCYAPECKPWIYALGLTGEAGEVADKIKKVYRDNCGSITTDKKNEIAKELGDVLWYLTRLGASLGYSLQQIADMNLLKLAERQSRNAIHGSGDNR